MQNNDEQLPRNDDQLPRNDDTPKNLNNKNCEENSLTISGFP